MQIEPMMSFTLLPLLVAVIGAALMERWISSDTREWVGRMGFFLMFMGMLSFTANLLGNFYAVDGDPPWWLIMIISFISFGAPYTWMSFLINRPTAQERKLDKLIQSIFPAAVFKEVQKVREGLMMGRSLGEYGWDDDHIIFIWNGVSLRLSKSLRWIDNAPVLAQPGKQYLLQTEALNQYLQGLECEIGEDDKHTLSILMYFSWKIAGTTIIKETLIFSLERLEKGQYVSRNVVAQLISVSAGRLGELELPAQDGQS